MNKQALLLIVCVVLAGATGASIVKAGRLQAANLKLKADAVQARESLELARKTPPPPAVATPAPDTAADLKMKRLEDQVRELRELLASRDRELAAADQKAAESKAAPTNTQDRAARGDRRFRGEDLEELRKTDPERAKEIEQQRTEFRDRIKTAADDQINFLQAVDVAKWTAEQQENHAKLLAMIAEFKEMMTQGPGAFTQNGDNGRNMFDRMREAGELMEQEQAQLLFDTGRQMGLDDKGSKEFVDYIQTIQKATSARGYFPGFGRGGRGRGNDGGANPAQPAPQNPQP